MDNSLKEGTCSLNLHSLRYLCKSSVAPVLPVTGLFGDWITSGSCGFSLGLSLTLEEVAGGSGWLRPLLAPGLQR